MMFAVFAFEYYPAIWLGYVLFAMHFIFVAAWGMGLGPIAWFYTVELVRFMVHKWFIVNSGTSPRERGCPIRGMLANICARLPHHGDIPSN